MLGFKLLVSCKNNLHIIEKTPQPCKMVAGKRCLKSDSSPVKDNGERTRSISFYDVFILTYGPESSRSKKKEGEY